MYPKGTQMTDKKVRIDEYLLKKIQEFRKKNKNNYLKYPSDKHFVHIAILNLLKKEEREE